MADAVGIILFHFLLICVILSGKQDIMTDKRWKARGLRMKIAIR